MTYLELYEHARHELNCNRLTLGEWSDMVEPLRREISKTGHWIKTKEQDDAEPLILWECSECLTVQRLKTNYCPNCGAKMIEPHESEANK